MKNRLLAVLLVSLLLCCSPLLNVFAAVEEYTAIGIITTSADPLNCRAAADPSATILTKFAKGATVNITGRTTVNGTLWYQVSFQASGVATTGYCVAQYITIYQYTEDTDFEAWLTQQNFPDSYKPSLRVLHTLHPKWIFNAQHVAVTWPKILDDESTMGVNMVPSSSLDSWKSFEKGAYDWSAGNWVGLDGSSWVAASDQITSYYLDPRNSLGDTSVFQFLDLSYDSTATYKKEYIDAVFAPSFLSGNYTVGSTTYSYSQTVLDAGVFSGTNPYMLATRLYQEQGVNGNSLAHGTVSGYEGYYNYFNINAYATSKYTTMQNGAIYASGTNETYLRPWDNPYKSICGGAKFIASSYINRGQCTLYLQKFDILDVLGNGTYSHQYMSNVCAPSSEAASLKKVFTGSLLESSLSFLIPVFDEMSQVPQSMPTSSGNNNNWLDTLAADGLTLSPEYTLYTTNYDLLVNESVSSVNISATAKDSKATVTGTGAYSLDYGDNLITLSVTAPSGVIRKYTINVYRSGSPPDDAEYLFSTTLAKDGTYLSGIPEGMTLSKLKESMTIKGYDAYYLNPSQLSLVDQDVIGTGTTLALYKGSALITKYTLLVPGDANGDGAISSKDLLRAQKHIVGISFMTDAQVKAADVNKDGALSSKDLLRCQKYIIGIINSME